MNMVVVVMPTLLFVTTLSGAIHLAHYWKFHAVDHSPAVAVELALVAAKSPCVWASLTTRALGLASLVTSALRPVRDFGLYSAIGVSSRWGGARLSARPVGLVAPRPPKRKNSATESGRNTGGDRPALAESHGGDAGDRRRRSRRVDPLPDETKVIRYFPDSSRIVADYVVMERELAGIVPIEVLVRFDESSREN